MSVKVDSPTVPQRKASMRVGDLVEDMQLYPRRMVDGANVTDLVDAIRSGAVLPPVVADQESKRIVDGFHRCRAHLRVFGADHKVDVILKAYPTEADAFADAVRLNRTHGRKLNSNDLIKSFNRLQEYGVGDDEIELIVRIPKAKVEKLRFRVAFLPDGEGDGRTDVPLKGGDAHLKGHTLKPEDIPVLDRRLGVSYGRLARQIIDGAAAGLLPDDEAFWAVMVELHETVGAALIARG